MNKIAVNKETKRSVLTHLMLCGMLSLSSTIQATAPHDAPSISQEVCSTNDNPHKVVYRYSIPVNRQCLYTTIIMGYLLPVRQDKIKLTARTTQLFGLQSTHSIDQLCQNLQDVTYLYSDAFSTLVTAFITRIQLKKGTWDELQAIQTISNKLKVNIQEYYSNPNNRINLVQANLTKPDQGDAAITIHIMRNSTHLPELPYQHYPANYKLSTPIPISMWAHQQPAILHQMRSSLLFSLLQWFDAAQKGNKSLLTALHCQYNIYIEDYIEERNAQDYTALMKSAENGHLDCLKYLLQQGAQVDASDQDGYTALLLSAENGHLDCLKYLIQQGADIETRDNDRNTALILTTWEGHLDCATFLLQQGARINVKNKYDNTALLLSAEQGHLACVKYLIQKGADITIRGTDQYTAFLRSAQEGRLDCLQYLLQQGADLHAKNKWGNTALILSARKGHLNCLQYLCLQGADLHAKDSWGNSSLLYSAWAGHLDCLKHLLQQGANLYHKNKNGSTALTLSTSAEKLDCVQYLIAQQPNLLDNKNNPMDID